ncbi:uncharacterized protein GGS22DRAFT_70604 [Annulohypoxylon maeteangense]|uniref:uncharacterized protein n=1 Tax=Annulohypoxylon maeteangense TaxID=1927788 RepID=UPI00200784CA|nr:uncharacterized protein GGS22DRAFT_70604 [Annulohypoxylon maeteangense]KAI0889396.1 hypothetical protein GGS22DRAFT_70604 [Annulohypoxylon maeteangense]
MHTASTPPAQTSGSGSGSMPYPALPASPTLTNPDMILPDYDDTCSSPDRSHSPLIMWKNAHAAEMGFDLSAQAFTTPVTPTTPIIYGNGTMLSDIGEVTEVESTCPPNKPRSGSTRSDGSMHPISLSHYDIIKKKDSKIGRERRLSMESTSTITNHDQGGTFADFDDAVSVDDSNFQGDDEESVADSYIDDAFHENAMAIKEARRAIGQERYSTALSRRAEQILANAKRRLTTMEGNLTRARSSLSSPTFSIDSGSTPSPTSIRPTTAIHRDHDANSREISTGHTRISSENNIPTLPTDLVKPGAYIPRSSSALGAAGGYRPPLHSPRSADYIHGSTRSTPMDGSIYGSSAFARSKPSLQIREHLLEPLSEDDASQDVDSRPSLEDPKLDNFLSPTFGSYSDKGLKRSASTTQMRDLKDQMKDLKGRLSTLRDQARADNLKRRSLQSLRTPSPFTHAQVDQWYAGTAQGEDEGSVHSDYKSQLSNEDVSSIDDGAAKDLAVKQMSPHASEESIPNGFSTVEDSEPSPLGDGDNSSFSSKSDGLSVPNQPEDDADDLRTEDGSDEDVDGVVQEEEEEEEEDEDVEAEMDENDQSVFEDDVSDSGASAYYDSVQNQVSHEDREDAFDYEHFFLHSAMGSMSRSRMRKGSRDSFSSEDSVETTRGPVTTSKTRSTAGKAGSRSRRGSHGSISSIESFATATEGRLTRAENEAAEAYHGHGVIIPQRARTHTPDAARRARLSTETSDSGSDNSRPKPSNIRRPQSSAAAFMHRPSVSSFDSSKTHRSFPLVNKPKVNGGILTPRDSPDRELKRISEVFLNESLNSIQSGDNKTSPIEMLQKDDRILVERLIAGLGRSVLGLAESGRGSADYRAYRRKIEAARRVLENLDAQA